MTRTRAAFTLLAVLLAVAALACGGDDDDGGATSPTTEEGAAPDDGAGGEGTSPDEPGPDDPEGTDATPPASDDTAPRDPDSPLRAVLTDPAEVGEGYAPDPGLGDGTFEVDLCEEVTVDATWEESGSQALSRASGEGTTFYSESVLGFADAAAAEAFVDAAVEGYLTCLPDMERSDPDVGDGAVVLRNDDLVSTQVYALVVVGERVAALRASTDPGGDLPVDDELLAAVASRLAG